MGYRVRNQHGELHFTSFSELKDAYLHDLVEADDEVCEDGATHWQKAGTLPRLAQAKSALPSAFQREGKWYVLAAGLVAAGIYFVVRGWDWVTFALVAVLVASLIGWTTFSSVRRRS